MGGEVAGTSNAYQSDVDRRQLCRPGCGDVRQRPLGTGVEAHWRMHEHMVHTPVTIQIEGKQRSVAMAADLRTRVVACGEARRWPPAVGRLVGECDQRLVKCIGAKDRVLDAR